ncbi:benzoate 4-monooxygenase cytochrome P450 [Fusarium pseudocircinatum]|uniref:Benzoate 4-monooxygenase cytochrome P450 n=1 Tax=Fusarium pseudocircinatum TaxID=56676 RepID=A0A8H5PIW8_9HYPO|nr:benzoate 4-monooxygenase cytochrome P450 [Fusarium pseudocircinatum]
MAVLSPSLFAGAAALIFIGVLIVRLRSPLASLPGPRLGLLTPWQLRYHELCGKRTQYIHQMHQKYGNAVRLAPNEVVFSSLDAMKEIYLSKGSGFDKTSFYNLFSQFGLRTMFSTLPKGPHSQRRRVIADRYANTNVNREASLHGIQERSQNFITRCQDAPKQELDVYMFLHCYAFDCVTHHLFHPHGSDSILQASDEETLHEAVFDNSLVRRLLNYYHPTLGSVAGKLGLFGKSRGIPRATELVLNGVKKGGVADFTLVSRMQEEKFGMGTFDIASECMDHMLAGIETTGDALCFLMWQISQPSYTFIQERLRDEFRANPDVPSDQLEYLEAVVKEGLRVFPSIPMSLPRCVPEGGATVDGHWLPGGTIVSCQPYSMHRMDEEVFPRPDCFEPQRWLEEKGSAERNRLFFAFSNGGRACIGRHLAIVEMKTLLRDIYSRYRTAPADGMISDMSPEEGVCAEAGSICKYEVTLSWGGRSFAKSTFGKCLHDIKRTDNTPTGNGFVYSTTHAQSPGPRASRRTAATRSAVNHGRALQHSTESHVPENLPNTQDGNVTTTDASLMLRSDCSPEVSSRVQSLDSPTSPLHDLQAPIPRPQRQISFLPPMAQYLFQFYLSETMRLTVPSSYAKTEICRFLVPMSQQEPSLLYAVMAFAAVHLDAIGMLPGNSRRLIDSLHWASINHLRRLLEDADTTSQTVALATTRTLCQAQIYGGTSLWRIHLDGARAILQTSQKVNQVASSPRIPVNTGFLDSWFHNAEALASLSPAGLLGGQLLVRGQSESGVFLDIYGGVMSDLPALFKEVGALLGNKHTRTPELELETDNLVQQILDRLSRDKAENMIIASDMLSSLSANDIQNYALSNAGFLYMALLHLYCSMRSLPPFTIEVRFCVAQIIQCAHRMYRESGLSPRVLLVSPLFTAGLYAIGSARDEIRHELADIGRWMKTPHLFKTLELLERVWLQHPDDSTRTWETIEDISVDFLPY